MKLIVVIEDEFNRGLIDIFFFFKHKTAYEMRISDWSSDVCSSDLQKNRIEKLRLIPVAVVAEDRDDRMTGTELAREADGAGDIDAAGPAEAEPFLLQ